MINVRISFNHSQLTICLTAMYMLLNTDRIKKATFRNFVYFLLASFVFDIFWLFASWSAYVDEKKG